MEEGPKMGHIVPIMSQTDEENQLEDIPVNRDTVSEWVKNLSERDILTLEDDGWNLALRGPLSRTVDTEPLDELVVVFDENNVPDLLSVERIDDKRKLVISVDSNRIPNIIKKYQHKSEKWIRRFRYTMWVLIVISALTFMIQSIWDISITGVTAIPRFIVFIISVSLYGIVGRIHLRGVAYGLPVSIHGCSNCGATTIENQTFVGDEYLSCEDCGSDMVPLFEGDLPKLRTQSKEFEQMVGEELNRLKE